MRLTHREFVILSEENVERTHDENEREAMYALMYAVAHRGKGKRGKLPTVTELYNRDNMTSDSGSKNKAEEVIEKQRYAEEWLSQFDLSALNED